MLFNGRQQQWPLSTTNRTRFAEWSINLLVVCPSSFNYWLSFTPCVNSLASFAFFRSHFPVANPLYSLPQLVVLILTTHFFSVSSRSGTQHTDAAICWPMHVGSYSVGWPQRVLLIWVGITSRRDLVGVSPPYNKPAHSASSVGSGLRPGDPRDHQLAIQDAHRLASAY